MKTLHKKLRRELWRQKGQVFTIALVVSSGIAGEVSMRSTWHSLVKSKEDFYTRAQFADVFAHVQHAPRHVLDSLRALPQVTEVEGHTAAIARLEIPGYSETVRGQCVSLSKANPLNAVVLKSGRLPVENNEVVLSELFARAHRLTLGSPLWALLNGRKTQLSVVGTGMSPEYVWAVSDFSQMGDEKRFGVLWMNEPWLVSAFHHENGFNRVSLRLAKGARPGEAMESVERILAPYGVFSVVGRDRQPSNQLVEQELTQLKTSATFAPLIFLGVAAFLLNVMLSRVVESQREHLATLKALGYRHAALARHVMAFALVVVTVGSLLGVALGAWAGTFFVKLYTEHFHFPSLVFSLHPESLLAAVGWSLFTGLFGSWRASRQVFRLAPAEALRAEAPAVFRPTLLERMGWQKAFPILARMVWREVERHPFRSGFSALGVAMATAILVMGNMGRDAVEYIFELQFDRALKQDVTVFFMEALPQEAALALARVSGVVDVESRRMVPVRIKSARASRETLLWGMAKQTRLQTLLDVHGREQVMPIDGVLISSVLAEVLGVKAGDEVEVEVLEGKRKILRLPVASTIDDTMGLQAYMDEQRLFESLSQTRKASTVALRVDEERLGKVLETLEGYPKMLGVMQKKVTREALQKNLADSFLTMQAVLWSIAVSMAVGVVYNHARMALSQRSRDLATLRILGFQKSEVATLLLGEQALVWAVGIPIGIPLGKALGRALLSLTAAEVFRIPVVMSPRTWATASVVVASAGMVSALWVIRRARRLNLVAVLKARD